MTVSLIFHIDLDSKQILILTLLQTSLIFFPFMHDIKKLYFVQDADLQKILHSRQLGLKLIANVTYGYTSGI
jgi:hypothetical protein